MRFFLKFVGTLDVESSHSAFCLKKYKKEMCKTIFDVTMKIKLRIAM